MVQFLLEHPVVLHVLALVVTGITAAYSLLVFNI